MKKQPQNWKNLGVGTPAIYRIRIKGYLDSSLSERLGGFQVTNSRMDDGTEISMLVGRIVDQANLTGIMNALAEMQMPVLEVKCLDTQDI